MNQTKLEKPLNTGRQRKHGGFSLMTPSKTRRRRAFLVRYLSNARAGLVADIGGSEDALSTQQLILIDRVVSKLAVTRGIEEFIRETSIFPKGELAPALKNHYLTYCNSIRLDLVALGLEKRGDSVLNPLEIINAYDAEKASREAEGKKTLQGRKANGIRHRLG